MDFKDKLQTEIKASIYSPYCKVELLGNIVYIKCNYLSQPAAAELITICNRLNIILSISTDKHSDNLIVLFTNGN